MKFYRTKLPNASRWAAGINSLVGIFIMVWTFVNKTTAIHQLIVEFLLFLIGAVLVIYFGIPEFRQAALEDRILKAMINEKEWNKENEH